MPTLPRQLTDPAVELALEHIAADEAALRAELVEARADRDAYRVLAQVALERVTALEKLVDRQRQTIRRFLELERAERRTCEETA